MSDKQGSSNVVPLLEALMQPLPLLPVLQVSEMRKRKVTDELQRNLMKTSTTGDILKCISTPT